MTTWYLYKQMTDEATLIDADKTKAVKANTLYKQAKLLLNGCAKTKPSLNKYTSYWD